MVFVLPWIPVEATFFGGARRACTPKAAGRIRPGNIVVLTLDWSRGESDAVPIRSLNDQWHWSCRLSVSGHQGEQV